MKKIFKYIMFLTIGVLAAACTYDESELGGQIENINDRIEKLKGDIEVLNTQLGSLNEIAKGNPITKVTKDSDGKYVITYLNDKNEEKTIVLATMEQMVKVPILGVKQESETSPFYWTVDDEWLTKDGQKVPVSGFAPDVTVDAEGYWTIDGERIKDFNGNDLYAHDGESCLFKSIETDQDGDLVITQGNGNVITIPVQGAINLTLSVGINTPVLSTANPVNITYEVTGVNSKDAMVAIADAQGLGAVIDRETKTITVTFASAFTSGYVVVIASDLEEHMVIRPVFFSTGSGEGGGGSDEPLDYYPIYNAQDLVAFASGVNAGTGMESMDAKLMNDIDMSGITSWTPIGHCVAPWSLDNTADYWNKVKITSGTPFKGHFDGQGFTIKNFRLVCSNSVADKPYGMFGTLAEGAIVENIIFDSNCSITSSPTVRTDCGLVAGLVWSSTVKNITNHGAITYSGNGAPDDVRQTLAMIGLAYADNNNVTIENLTNKGAIVSKNSGHNTKNGATGVQVAGILGLGTNGVNGSSEASAGDMAGYVNVVNCTNDGNMTSDAARTSGIVASCNRFTFVDGCTNNGNQTNTHAVDKGGRLGNITCITGSGSKLRNCTNTGDLVSSTNARIGGVVGFINHNSNTFENCHNTGNIISGWDAGLFFGYDNVTATFTNCSVSGSTGTYNGGSYSMNNVTSSNYISSKYVGNIGSNATAYVTTSTIRYVGENAVGIKSAADLVEFASLVNSGASYAKFQAEDGVVYLLKDIDMSSVTSWTPIGYATVPAGDGEDKAITGNAFAGKFDGNAFKIKNLKMVANGSTAGQNYGLFGTLAPGAVVQHFTIDESCSLEVTATARIATGVVAGFVYDATVRDVTNYAPMTFNGKVANDFMSMAMIGQVYANTIGTIVDSCHNYGEIVANNTTNTESGAKAYHAAGVVGFAHSVLDCEKVNTISSCSNNAKMTSALARTSGICCAANRSTEIFNCDNHGDQINSFTTVGGARLGNIACVVTNSCVVSGCTNYGDLISTTKGRIGGITSLPNRATFTNCANYGEILTDQANGYRGVFFGFNGNGNGSVWKNCTAGGKVGTYNNGSPVYDSYTDAEKESYLGKFGDTAQTYENITYLIGTTEPEVGTDEGGIDTAAEYLAFLQAVNAGTSLSEYMNTSGEVILNTNLDLSSITNAQWQAIADGTSVTNNTYNNTIAAGAFTGTFNGNSKKITGFNPTVSLASGKTFGLLPILNGATVKNLEISGAMKLSATAVADAGMLCGTALNSTISNVKVSGTINSTGISVDEKRFAIGGICGYAVASGSSTCTIESCTSDVVATAVGGTNLTNGASAAMYGGIVGYATAPNDETSTASVVLSGCTNNGNMNVTLGRCSGIVASAMRHVSMTNCTNNGNQVNAIANGRLGNVCSVIQYWCTATNCKNYGTIEATATNYAGNVAGMFGLVGDKASINISGGGNYGTVKVSPSSTNTNYGLIGGYLNVFESISNVVVSGKLYVNGSQVSVSASNYMDYIGRTNASHASKITGLTYVAPTN